uniref:Uncharacterized protein n=1 Tax=Arion vulgaris TaxID=1028688 RepID=A0A0B7B1H0_9EUPU
MGFPHKAHIPARKLYLGKVRPVFTMENNEDLICDNIVCPAAKSFLFVKISDNMKRKITVVTACNTTFWTV